MKKLFVVIVFTQLSIYLKCEELKYASIDILGGGIVAGIQSCFSQKPTIKSISKAFYKGCIGGAIQHSSKLLIKQSALNNNFDLVWPARICNSLGTSIIYNASQNKGLFDEFYMQFYFMYLKYDVKNNKFNTKVDIITSVNSLYMCINNNYKFNFIKSLKLNVLYFDNYEEQEIKPYVLGRAIGNSMYVVKQKFYRLDNEGNYYEIDKNLTVRHEFIHILQYEQYIPLNSISIDKLHIKYVSDYCLLNINFGLLYFINDKIFGYDNNIFEKQANYYKK